MAEPQPDIVIIAPDGSRVRFPAGTPEAEILTVMRREFPPPTDASSAVGGAISQGLTATRIRQQLNQRDPRVTGGEVSLNPEFASFGMAPVQAATGMFLDSRPEAQADVVQAAYGDVERGVDRAGRPIVRRPGGRWTYVNAPGLSFQDVANVGSELVRFGAAALPTAQVRGFVPRALATGGTSAAMQAGSQAGSAALGSQQGVSLPDVALAGVAGAGGEMLGAAVAPLMRPAATVPPASGPDVLRQFMDLGSGAAASRRAEDALRRNPEAVAPFGVPLTRGQITQDPRQIAFEQAAARGGRGELAERVMRPALQDQAQAIAEAGRGLAGPRVIATDVARATGPAAGQVIRAGLTQAETMADDAVQAAYRRARSFDATVAAQNFSDLRARLRSALPDDIRAAEDIGLRAGAAQRAPARDIVADVDTIVGRAQSALEQGANAAQVSFRAVEAMRSALETQRRALAAKPGNETAAMLLGRQKQALDQWVDDTVEGGLWSGDEQFLQAFREARRARREFAQRFEAQPDQAAQRAVRQIIDRDMNAGSVVDVIFGAGQTISNRYAAGITRNVVDILGRESVETQALREAFVDRMVGPLQGQEMLAPRRVAENLRAALDGTQRETVAALFSPQEIRDMRRFVALLDRVTPPAGTVNTSGTAYELNRVMGGLAAQAVNNPLLRVIINRVEGLTGGALNEAAAREALRGARSVALAPRLAVAATPVAVGQTNLAGQESQRLDSVAQEQAAALLRRIGPNMPAGAPPR
jgi:hypothetical protein